MQIIMEFNEFWTKKDNDEFRQLIKEGKSIKYIIEYFGMNKLKHHPKKKFSGNSLPDFDSLNQIKNQ